MLLFFVPGGYGAMTGIPQDRTIVKVLNWAHQNGLFTLTLCHGPGAFLSSTLDDQQILHEGDKMAVFLTL